MWAEPYHPEDDNPVFDFKVVTPRPGRVLRTRAGFDLHVEHGLDEAAGRRPDLPGAQERPPRHLDAEVSELLRSAHARGAMLFAHCSATFMLGEAGLLDGRRCTTHWRYAAELAARFPEAVVDPDVLYVQDGTIVTGAGSAAAIDAALHVMRQQFGAKVAAATARRMVVPPHRDGGQAQYIARPVPVCESEALAPLLAWISSHLADDLDVETLARQMHMSARTFARRFKEETGTTPYSWIPGQRVRAAQELLEQSDHSIDWVASEVGFGNAATLRHHFGRVRGSARRSTGAPSGHDPGGTDPGGSRHLPARRRHQKGGTAWMHRYLESSPQCDPGFRKEYHVWDALDLPSGRVARERIENQGGDRARFLHEPDHYFDYFCGLLGAPRHGSPPTSPPPTPGSPCERLAMVRAGFESRGVRPVAVYLMRDPVERVWSAVRMDVRRRGIDHPGAVENRLGRSPTTTSTTGGPATTRPSTGPTRRSAATASSTASTSGSSTRAPCATCAGSSASTSTPRTSGGR